MKTADNFNNDFSKIFRSSEFLTYLLSIVHCTRGNLTLIADNRDGVLDFYAGYPDVDTCADTWVPEDKYAPAVLGRICLDYLKSIDYPDYDYIVSHISL